MLWQSYAWLVLHQQTEGGSTCDVHARVQCVPSLDGGLLAVQVYNNSWPCGGDAGWAVVGPLGTCRVAWLCVTSLQ